MAIEVEEGQPWDVFVSPTNGYAPQRVTDLHADVPHAAMGRTQLVSWTSTEGFEIEGLLTYPVGYEEGERVPLILNVHGGPAGVYSQSFTGSPAAYMLQYFAQEGFAILRPNPRGSTGYGKDFRYANFQDWGYGDFRDLMSGVDHVIDMGVADPGPTPPHGLELRRLHDLLGRDADGTASWRRAWGRDSRTWFR